MKDFSKSKKKGTIEKNINKILYNFFHQGLKYKS